MRHENKDCKAVDMSDKVKSAIQWVAINGALIAVAEMAMYCDNEGAMRLLKCYSWAMLVCSLFSFSAVKEQQTLDRIERYEQSRFFPRWMGEIVDVTVGCWLIWYGEVWTGMALILSEANKKTAWSEAVAELRARKERAETEATTRKSNENDVSDSEA